MNNFDELNTEKEMPFWKYILIGIAALVFVGIAIGAHLAFYAPNYKALGL